jgi:hypothetical protein
MILAHLFLLKFEISDICFSPNLLYIPNLNRGTFIPTIKDSQSLNFCNVFEELNQK